MRSRAAFQLAQGVCYTFADRLNLFVSCDSRSIDYHSIFARDLSDHGDDFLEQRMAVALVGQRFKARLDDDPDMVHAVFIDEARRIPNLPVLHRGLGQVGAALLLGGLLARLAVLADGLFNWCERTSCHLLLPHPADDV